MSRRPALVALVVLVALAASTLGTVPSGASTGARARGEVEYIDPVEREADVVAARERADAARSADGAAVAAVDAARTAEEGLRATAERAGAELGELDARIAEVETDERAALDRYEVARKAYVDTAVAAYVAGAPSSLELKASLIEEPVERARSLALAESVGDVFSQRSSALDRTREAISGRLRDLAEDRVSLASASDAADRDLAAARSTLDGANAARADTERALQQADAALEAARAEAKRRIDEAAERFRLGSIDIDELRRLADPRVAVGDIPVRAYEAYVNAARIVDAQLPACKISWWALAAIGKIETRHGTYGGAVILPNGDVAPRILGPPLTGGAFARVTDTDGGRLDGDTVHDRAVGPMQFIPSTWAASGADGNGDGVADPHNYFDAAVAAARYLCRGARGVPLDTEAGMRAGALSYNRSQHYANVVIDAARGYGGLGGTAVTVPD